MTLQIISVKQIWSNKWKIPILYFYLTGTEVRKKVQLARLKIVQSELNGLQTAVYIGSI